MSDIPFRVIKSKRRSMAIQVLRDGSVEVKAPNYIPKFLITSFVNSKKDWINKRVNYVLKNKIEEKKFQDGEKFFYLGETYFLKLGDYTEVKIHGQNFLFPIALASRGKIVMEKWYIKQAKEVIRDQVDYCAKKMNVTYKSISFSDTKSKWGSCTHDNRLQFNWRLVLAPMIVLRYVVIHELAHTQNKNHSSDFWRMVKNHNPSYKQQIKWLKIHGENLHI